MNCVCDGTEKGNCEEGGQTNSINMQPWFLSLPSNFNYPPHPNTNTHAHYGIKKVLVSTSDI